MRSPRVLQLIMDSLRYWVIEMHVDGFRFDLASALARELHAVDKLGAFFDIVHQDPVLSQVKLIAEPWDLGEGGYQVGNFPIGWTEWNGKYRDTVRRFWRGDGGVMSEMATRLAGSSDLYEQSGRRPYASINFITAHDGFTLADLVSYEEKHNEANGEENRDGENNNLSCNCGVEGPTDDAANPRAAPAPDAQLHRDALHLAGRADAQRRRRGGAHPAGQQQRLLPGQRDQLDVLAPRAANSASSSSSLSRMIHIWRTQPVLRRRRFLQGRPIRGAGVKDIAWLQPSGHEMTDADWNAPDARRLGVRLSGDAIEELDAHGHRIVGDTLLILFNADTTACAFTLPNDGPDGVWELLVDTADPGRAATALPGDALPAGRPVDGRAPTSARGIDLRKSLCAQPLSSRSQPARRVRGAGVPRPTRYNEATPRPRSRRSS